MLFIQFICGAKFDQSSPLHNAYIEQFGGSLYKIAQYLTPSHQRCLRINRAWDSGTHFEPNSVDTEPPKMARYIALCRFRTKFENLECEIHENLIFSIFLRVVCARIKICSMVYSLQFFKIYPSANNLEDLNCSMEALCTAAVNHIKEKGRKMIEKTTN